MPPSFFRAEASVGVPGTDLLSWIFDDPLYDLNDTIYISANDPSRRLTGAECKDIIRKLVKGFKDAGLKRGDCVLVHSFNDINYPLIVLGAIGAGGIWTGSNPSNTTTELAHHIRTSSARFVISEPEILAAVRDAGDICGIPRENCWVFDVLPEHSVPQGHKSWRELLSKGEADWERISDEDTARKTTAMRMFSSGTTGLPKAANISHYNLVAQYVAVNDYKPRLYKPSYCLALPMFHAGAAHTAHLTMLRGGFQGLILRRFDLELFMRTYLEYKVTEIAIVPPMVLAMVMSPLTKGSYFVSVRNSICGAAPLGLALQKQFEAMLPPSTPMTQVWGMTETSSVATRIWHGQRDESGSVGYLVPGLEAKLIDDDGREIREYGKPGEMCVRGNTVFQGYHQNPEANKASFSEDGFYFTGDIMYCDEKTKKWFIIDRKKELIKVRSFQVAPPEIESVLLSHPLIVDAAVIGITAHDHSTGAITELPRAYVVKRPGSELTEKEVYDFSRERLATYKRLDGGVVFLEVIPKNASGKILKNALRNMAKKERTQKGPRL